MERGKAAVLSRQVPSFELGIVSLAPLVVGKSCLSRVRVCPHSTASQFLWSGSAMFGSAESEVVRLISREIIFQEF